MKYYTFTHNILLFLYYTGTNNTNNSVLCVMREEPLLVFCKNVENKSNV